MANYVIKEMPIGMGKQVTKRGGIRLLSIR